MSKVCAADEAGLITAPDITVFPGEACAAFDPALNRLFLHSRGELDGKTVIWGGRDALPFPVPPGKAL